MYAYFLHGDVTIEEIAANKHFNLEPGNEHNFVLVMGIYENADRLEDMERVGLLDSYTSIDLSPQIQPICVILLSHKIFLMHDP